MAEYEIVLQLCAPEGVDREALETDMFEVLSVVEDRAADVALGPVVAVDFAAREIELAFIVEADDVQGAHAAVGRVLQTIDSASDVNLTPRVTTTSATPEAHSTGLCVA